MHPRCPGVRCYATTLIHATARGHEACIAAGMDHPIGRAAALVLAGLLAACATPPSAPGAPATPQTATPTLPEQRSNRPAIGIVQSASVVALSSSSSSAGGTGGATTTPTMAYRVQMPDGSVVSVVQAGERFEPGDRVQITAEGRAVRP
jgi:type IV pilus biogenesis protein CpaD/CtpE